MYIYIYSRPKTQPPKNRKFLGKSSIQNIPNIVKSSQLFL